MNMINMKKHMYLDFLVVALFLAAPLILGFEGIAQTISFALAVIHATVTALTFVPGISLISGKVHGTIELLVGPLLIALPWVVGFSSHLPATIFFTVMGLTTLLAWGLTDYKQAHV